MWVSLGVGSMLKEVKDGQRILCVRISLTSCQSVAQAKIVVPPPLANH